MYLKAKSPVVIHMHIPKTAGSSLNSSLVSSFKAPLLAYNDSHKNVDLPKGKITIWFLAISTTDFIIVLEMNICIFF